MTFQISAENRRKLDLIEQAAVILLYGWMVARLWPGEITATNWYPLLILPSEGLVLLLLLFRRRTDQISTNLWDWAVAAIGTTAVLLVDKGSAPVLGLLGPYLMLLGLLVHVGAKLSLWRSFGLVAANRGVKVGGLYRFVRHPMYAGYILSHIGFLLATPSLWNAAVYAVAWAALVARMDAEERVLIQDASYSSYCANVRYRLLPGVY
ncbi:MAG: DUF1295 domain-containing protein [Alphaproteobacteria bacterium]|nr:DUF1295 domain-containing protein [Alphaproteobacteria bacterium]